MSHNEFIPTEVYIPEGPASESSSPYYNGVATRSRNEVLSSVWGGGQDSDRATSNKVGMQASWNEGSWSPTQVDGPPDVGGFSARSESGRPLGLGDITGDSIVKIGGEEMTAAAAEHLGFLVRDPTSGLLRLPGAGEELPGNAERDSQQDQQNDQVAPEALDDASEAILAQAYESAPGEALAAANDIMATGEVSAHTVEQLASRLGLEPDQVVANVEHVRAAYHKEAVSVSSRRVGVSPAIAEAALEYARLNNHGELMHAAEQHIHSGKARYDSFVRDYVQKLDSIAPDYILSSLPNKARWDTGAGQIVVKTGRGEMLWGAAVRAGLVKL